MQRKEYKRIIKNIQEEKNKLNYQQKLAVAYSKPEYAKMLELNRDDIQNVYSFYNYPVKNNKKELIIDFDNNYYERECVNKQRYLKKFVQIVSLDKDVVGVDNMMDLFDLILLDPSTLLHKDNQINLRELTATVGAAIHSLLYKDDNSKEITKDSDLSEEELFFKDELISILSVLKVRQNIYNDNPIDINPTKNGLCFNERTSEIKGVVEEVKSDKAVKPEKKNNVSAEKIWI